MRKALVSTMACLAVAAVAAVGAQQVVRTADPAKRGLKESDFPRTIKLADNVYGYEELRPVGGNDPGKFTTVSLFVVTSEGVLLADGQGNPEATAKLLDAIRAVTDKPLTYYVVGSDHGDHTGGNAVLPAGVTMIATATSKAQMERDAANPNRPATAPRAVIPNETLAGDRKVITLGGEEIQILFLGRAHTGGDLSVYLPKEKILFMSEAYLNRCFPAMRSAYPTEWVAVVDRALKMDVRQYVPGHGFIEDARTSREELVTYQQALRAVIAETTRLHAEGLAADEAVKRANFGEYDAWSLAASQKPIAVRKIYDELDGKLPRPASH